MQTVLDDATCNPECQRWKAHALFAFLIEATEPEGKLTKEEILWRPELTGIFAPQELAALRGRRTHSTTRKRKRVDISRVADLVACVFDCFIVWAWEQRRIEIKAGAVFLARGKKRAGFHGMRLRRSDDPSPWRSFDIPTSVQEQLDVQDDTKTGMCGGAKPVLDAMETRTEQEERKRLLLAAQVAVVDGTTAACEYENCDVLSFPGDDDAALLEVDLELLNCDFGAFDDEFGL